LLLLLFGARPCHGYHANWLWLALKNVLDSWGTSVTRDAMGGW